jgi:RNA polymerase sigma-70 factor (ECF subfamily)
MRRHRRHRVELQESESTDVLASLPQPTPRDHPLRISLEKSLKKLDQRSRTVFLLYEVEGFKHREIAEVLRIPEGTSKNILFNARKELQELLSEAGSLVRPSNEN